MPHVTRREFLQDSAVTAAGLTAVSLSATRAAADGTPENRSFSSRWGGFPDRVWLGREFWANPMQDWRIAGGRIECVNPAIDRNVHLLTRQIGDGRSSFQMSVRVGRLDGKAFGDGKGSVGFRIGIKGPLDEYRNSLIFGNGLDAGLTADGRLFVGPLPARDDAPIDTDSRKLSLNLDVGPQGDSNAIVLSVRDADTNELLGETRRENVPDQRLAGNVALVANFGVPQRLRQRGEGHPAGTGTFWFSDWTLDGDRLDVHDNRAFGPILFSQYTLHEGTLKLAAQMPPIGEQDSQTVRLQLKEGNDWKTVGEEPIHPQARTATFRIENWDASKDVPYRLVYDESPKATDGTQPAGVWTGTIRRDPVDKPVLTVADISCNIHAAFPNHDYVANAAKLDPDLLAFTGDQFYESSGGYGVVREPLDKAIDDYLRKWYLHGWTWRELMRDRPSISIPDDHDVYQGNIWGEAGAPQETTQEAGGYQMHPEWVNVVHRTQTSHHPDPFDPTPVKQDISVYYGPLTYGRISFAILADRQFKTAPEGTVPQQGPRADHVTDPDFDPATVDVEGAELLGERQLEFLRHWAADWRGADMKAVVSQTIFTSMATTHGRQRMRLLADYDSNGWPQSARNAALKEIRKAFAVHLAGDQHLPAVVHYGIDEHRDAGVAFAGPAVNVGYPRWWEPEQPGENRKPGQSERLGDFEDHFGHPMTVLAVKNGVEQPSGNGVLQTMEERASGLGIVRFDKTKRTITIECWPYLADPTQPDTQFEGWPVTVSMLDQYGRQPAAHLPTLDVRGVQDPVVQIMNEADGETVYTLRIHGTTFRPPVFATGAHTIRVSDPDTDRRREITGVKPTDDDTSLAIDV